MLNVQYSKALSIDSFESSRVEQLNSPSRVLITFPVSAASWLSCIPRAALVAHLAPESLLTHARLSVGVEASKHAPLVTLPAHVHREVSGREGPAQRPAGPRRHVRYSLTLGGEGQNGGHGPVHAVTSQHVLHAGSSVETLRGSQTAARLVNHRELEEGRAGRQGRLVGQRSERGRDVNVDVGGNVHVDPRRAGDGRREAKRVDDVGDDAARADVEHPPDGEAGWWGGEAGVVPGRQELMGGEGECPDGDPVHAAV